MKNILAFPGDTHAGSTVGLMQPDPWQLDAGGTYRPSKAQRLIWRQWVEGWDVVNQLRQPGDRLIITMMGDAVDGKHHDTSELVTGRIEEQERIFIDAMDWTLQHVNFGGDDVLQFISGTPAHVGEMAQSERRICEDMEGRGLYDRLKMQVGSVKFDVAHDGLPVGGRAWTDDSSLRAVIRSMLFDSLLNGQDVPDYVIRAHRHTFMTTDFERGKYHISGMICPAFQLKTSYGNRFTSTNNRTPSIGMLIVVVEDDRHWWKCPMMAFPKERYESI